MDLIKELPFLVNFLPELLGLSFHKRTALQSPLPCILPET